MTKQQYIDKNINEQFKHWLSLGAASGAIIFILLSVLDYVVVPGKFTLFILYRITIAALLLGISSASKKVHPDNVIVQHTLAYAAVIGSALTIEFMILQTGGHRSSYYAGMILLGVCVIGFIPARFSLQSAISALIYGIYVIPIFVTETITDFRAFFTSNYFLITVLVSALMLRYFGHKTLSDGLGLKYDLEQHQTRLEEQVQERTIQLSRTVRDLGKEIAERKLAEEALKQSEEILRATNERLEAILQSSPTAIITMTPDGVVTTWNKTSERIFGWRAEEVIGNFYPAVPEDKEEEFRVLREKVLREESFSGVEVSRRKKSGTLIDLSISTAALRDAAGRINGIMAVITDITERKRAEKALQESEEQFRTLFEESKDVFYISTPEGQFLDINPAGVKLFGYASKEEVLSLNITSDLYVNPEDRLKFIDVVDEANYTKDYEVEMKRKNGERLSVVITSTAMRDDRGKITAFRGVIRDITEQKKLEQQLLQSQKMEAVGQLAGGMAHDFNNILTAIVGYASLIQMKLQESDPQRVYAEHILASSERAASLIRSLLAFSRKQIMNPKPADLNEIVRNVEKLLLRLIGEDIEFTTVLSKEELMVVADSTQIEQVLMNLATNARDAMPRGGRFIIETSPVQVGDRFIAAQPYARPGRYAVLSVTDTGSGMDEKIREKIFEPFFTTKEVGKGTGLGLAMVYGIIKQHEGYITVASEAGKGATFTIYLPLRKTHADTAAVKQGYRPMPVGSETLLIAEDDDSVRAMSKSILTEFGYKVIEAVDGEDVVNKFLEYQDRIHLLILDVVMPKRNGKEVYESVRKVRPDIKVLFTSGYTADIIHAKGLLDEGLNFILKPIPPNDLLRKVRAVLDQ
jgi:PAS domain S-box-containing protein